MVSSRQNEILNLNVTERLSFHMLFFRSVDTLGSIQKKLQIHADAGAYKRYEQVYIITITIKKAFRPTKSMN